MSGDDGSAILLATIGTARCLLMFRILLWGAINASICAWLHSVKLHKAVTEGWIIITNDKDFGKRVFRERLSHRGVILLRLHDERAASKIQVLSRLLEVYLDQLPGSFVVVTESQVRFGQC